MTVVRGTVERADGGDPAGIQNLVADDVVSFGSRVRGWHRVRVAPDEPVVVRYATLPEQPHTRVQLRLFTAGEQPDSAWIRVHVVTGPAGLMAPNEPLPLRYSSMFQPWYVELTAAGGSHPGPLEIELSCSPNSEGPVWFFSDATAGDMAPCLIGFTDDDVAGDRALERFECALWSQLSVQPFNWHEGCVLDGMAALLSVPGRVSRTDRLAAIRHHLETFWAADGTLEYIGPLGDRVRDRLVGLEMMLPYAGRMRLADADAKHGTNAGLGRLDAFVARHREASGLVVDRGSDAEGRSRSETAITIEGCYTVAYPIALRAAATDNAIGMIDALTNLTTRVASLVLDGVVWQRRWGDRDPEQGDWARAVAWFLLGSARTWEVITGWLNEPPSREKTEPLLEAVRAVTARVLSAQLPSGGWRCYLTDESTNIDTSGSAGIAAGLLVWARLGALEPEPVIAAARPTLDALLVRVGPDGLLGGVAQLNRGGDEFQREPYRVHGQYGMGLMAQVIAELRRIGAGPAPPASTTAD